jgi:hypothetical protein|tara:strand:- start:345 stop:473 length:129 start_codon:yes stop_codon:yes gene_type:complete
MEYLIDYMLSTAELQQEDGTMSNPLDILIAVEEEFETIEWDI